MPVITITLIEGYDEATRRRLSQSLTDAARSVIAAPLDGVTVVVNEVPPANYMRGRVSRTPGPPLPAPRDIVESYLKAMEARALDEARTFLADDFTMTFPGGQVFSTLEQLIDWAKGRYQTIAKTYDSFDQVMGADGSIVYCFGTLSGKWPDGQLFSGIRFIDRFTLEDGRLKSQLVWNDLAEVQACQL